MSAPRIRLGEERDLPELVRIYNHYVNATHITFDTRAFTVDERRPWFEGFRRTGPYRLLVVEIERRSVGYASSRQFRAKPAYEFSVETTIYLDPSFVGQGLGQGLYRSLLDVLHSEENVHRAYGGVALPNPRSVALHERLGFTLVGTFHEVGFKHGRYRDVIWYEKDVSGGEAQQQTAGLPRVGNE